MFGGNILHSFNVPMQLRIYEIEDRTRVSATLPRAASRCALLLVLQRSSAHRHPTQSRGVPVHPNRHPLTHSLPSKRKSLEKVPESLRHESKGMRGRRGDFDCLCGCWGTGTLERSEIGFAFLGTPVVM